VPAKPLVILRRLVMVSFTRLSYITVLANFVVVSNLEVEGEKFESRVQGISKC
jgi:hypothetical protein